MKKIVNKKINSIKIIITSIILILMVMFNLNHPGNLLFAQETVTAETGEKSQGNNKEALKRRVENLIDQGIRYEHEDKLDLAIETFKNALLLDPDNILVKIRLAKILSWRGRYEEALKILNEVLKKEPNHSEALFRKAQILSWEGKYKEAIATYQIYLLKEKDDADALMGIARVCFWDGEYQRALEYFERAIKAGGDKVDAYMNMGKIYMAMGDKKTAKEMFKKVLEIDPGNREAKRFIRGIITLKTYEISPANLKWYFYANGSIGTCLTSSFLYHHRQILDLYFKFDDTSIENERDQTFTVEITYMGVPNLYLGFGAGFTYDPDFSKPYFGNINLHYRFGKIITPGIIISLDKFIDDTLITVKPELQKDFSDLSYARVRFNQYFFSSGYKTSTIELYIQFEYENNNTIYITATYGGDSEIKDPDRRIFDFGFGISYYFSEYLESTLSYGWIETVYGKTHQLSWQNEVKW